jgi:ligand-binding sensor domain-containing protein
MLINIHYLFCSCTIQALKYFLNLFFVITTIEAQARIGDFRSISSFANISNIVFTDSLLVGVSESGLIYFNPRNESVETVSIDEGLAFGGLSHIHIDKKNNFWIGSKKGIQVWDHRKKKIDCSVWP